MLHSRRSGRTDGRPHTYQALWDNDVMYYVYLLKSLKDKDLYTGSTEDLKRRFREHQQGSSIATRDRR